MQVFTDLQALPPFENTVVTIGSFDGVHTGHLRILEQVIALAQSCKGKSVVITFHPHPRQVLQPDDSTFRLLTDTDEKTDLLAQAGIDYTIVTPFSVEFSRQSARAYVEDFLLRNFRPRYIVIGYDHRFGNNRSGDIQFLKQYEAAHGFEVIEIPAQLIDDLAVSSTKIRKALEAGDLEFANRLLGHPFTLSGRVVEGDRIGRTIGFPTANIQLKDAAKLVPPSGVYAARTTVNGRQYDAMLYIGNRPTLDGLAENRIEVNLMDFTGDLYGSLLRVEVPAFIRPDKKLPDLQALQAQIEADKQAIKQVLATKSTSVTLQETAIVILNYNTRKQLAELLPAVLEHSAGARVVVADNGSPDDSVAYMRAEFPQVELIVLDQNYGFAEGYNQALRQVKARTYVLLNSDVLVTENWLTPVLEAMQADPTIAVAQPKIRALLDKERFEYAGAAGGWIDYLGYPFCRGRIFSAIELDQGQYDKPLPCFWASGAAFFIQADLYHAFGGFDGDYFAHNEEIDLCWRLQRAGYSVWCIPQSLVYHLGGGTLEYESPRKVYLNFRNSLFSLLKNEPAAKLLWLIPARLLLDGLAALRFALKGQWRSITAILRAHFSFYGAFSKTMEKRRQTAILIEQRRIGPPATSGMWRNSIVWTYYARQIKRFGLLKRLPQ